MTYDKIYTCQYVSSKQARECKGEGVDVIVRDVCDTQIRADIILKSPNTVRIWGQIRDCHGCPQEGVRVTLFRCECSGLVYVASTISDCQGFYKFELCKKNAVGKYKIVAARASDCEQECTSSACMSGGMVEAREERRHIFPHNNSADCRNCAYFDENVGACQYQ